MPQLTVSSAPKSYPIYIGNGHLYKETLFGAHLAKAKKIFVICDQNTEHLFFKDLQSTLKLANPSCEIIPLCVDQGEGSKSFSVFESLANNILSHKPTRHDVIIALGGGVVGDLAGFLASSILRGIGFVQVPTTLLSQVDSSVGGKTGINAKEGKNLIGAFYQPEAVVIDTKTLTTLPKREFAAGMAEVVKYGCLRDASFFKWLEDNRESILAQQTDIVEHMIAHCCQMKADIVAADEREEKSIRALLNFGHTFGHGIEKCAGMNGSVLHGEAVAIGMVMAADLSCQLGYIKEEVVNRLSVLLRQFHLPVQLSDLGLDVKASQLLDAMQGDKKADASGLVFIVLKELGEAALEKNIGSALLTKILNTYTG